MPLLFSEILPPEAHLRASPELVPSRTVIRVPKSALRGRAGSQTTIPLKRKATPLKPASKPLPPGPPVLIDTPRFRARSVRAADASQAIADWFADPARVGPLTCRRGN